MLVVGLGSASVSKNLISCEACGKQISSAAASCPGCGHPVRPAQNSANAIPDSDDEAPARSNRVVQAWVAIAILIAGVFFVLYTMTGGGSSDGPSSHTEAGPVEVAIGQPVEFTRYTVTVDKAVNEPVLGMTRDFQSGMDPTELIVKGILKQGIGGGASEGGTLIVVDYTVLNSSKTPLTVEDRPLIQLRDHNGTLLEKDETKTNLEQPLVGGGKMFSDLNPGMKERGTVVFEVAEDQFDPQTWKVVINGQALVSLASLKASSNQQGPVEAAVTDAPGASETPPEVPDSAALQEEGFETKYSGPTQSSYKCEPKGPTIVKGFNTDRAYPDLAVRKGVEGRVIVRYAIAADGSLASAEVVSADPPGIFEKSVLEEFGRMQWNPATNGDCEPVASEPLTQTINFRLG